MLDVEFNVDTQAITGYLAKLADGIDPNRPGPMQRALKRAAARYLGWIRKRYLAASKGDGTWPPLSNATKMARIYARKTLFREFKRRLKRAKGDARTQRARRRDVASGMRFEILRDTGTLFNSLSQGKPGAVEQFIPNGIRVGTAIKYGKYHQEGGGRLPKRAFLVPPEGRILDEITKELQRGMDEAAREARR